MRQCKWLNLVDNLWTLEVMSPDDQILIRFATNQKIHIWKKYKLDFKKYRKSDVEKYKNISNKILQSDRADLIESWLWFLLKEVGRVHAHPWLQVVQVDDHHYYHRLRFSAERLVFSPRRTCPQTSPTSPSLVWTSTSITPRRQLAASSSILSRVQRRLTTMWRRWGTASFTSIWTSTTCHIFPACVRSHLCCSAW